MEAVSTRRQFVKATSLIAGGLALPRLALPQSSAPPDYKILITPCTLEASPKHLLKTIAYNGQAPGPLLRLHEGRNTTVEVTNRTTNPEVVHWHGLTLPSAIDGAMEEGTPMIEPNATTRFTLNADPPGLRWYHTHTFAGRDMKKGQYTGQHGVLYVEPKDNPGRYDQELFLNLHDWDGRFLGSDDGAMAPTYFVSTINGRMLGFADPIRVRQGQKVLLHILNSSPTEVHWLALPGHTFHVIALDGNPVPNPQPVPTLRLAPAERISAIVDMNRPGTYILGEPRKAIREAGMGIILEYANATGKPLWQPPATLDWDYTRFGAATSAPEPTSPIHEIPIVIDSKFQGHGASEKWTLNGKSYPDTDTPLLERGQRYRLFFRNRSMDDHPLHLHRHLFELRRLPAPTHGILKDTVLVKSQTEVAVDFTANNPGDTLLHCHQQDHMDRGFMMLFRYA